mmetsp:Transcript_60598/g.121554  ORF Transcript_60598/g.121554 Transcript_60598/m.121554 type:complete len:234 (+) Transcript_60598:276-977(+)
MVRLLKETSAPLAMLKHCTTLFPSTLKPLPLITTPVIPSMLMVMVAVRVMSADSSITTSLASAVANSFCVVTVTVDIRRETMSPPRAVEGAKPCAAKNIARAGERGWATVSDVSVPPPSSPLIPPNLLLSPPLSRLPMPSSPSFTETVSCVSVDALSRRAVVCRRRRSYSSCSPSNTRFSLPLCSSNTRCFWLISFFCSNNKYFFSTCASVWANFRAAASRCDEDASLTPGPQ